METELVIAGPGGTVPPQRLTRRRIWPGARVDDLAHRGFGAVVITVPRRLVLVRALALPRAVLGRAGEVLTADLERTTPLRSADVLQGWFVAAAEPDRSDVTVYHVVLKQALVADLLQGLNRAQVPIRAIEIVDEAGDVLPVDLTPAGVRRDAGAVRAARGFVTASALALMAAIGAWWSADVYGLTQAMASTQAQVTALAAEAQRSRVTAGEAAQAADLARRARLRRIDTPMFTLVWDELSTILPDDTWLTELRLEDGAVALDGHAANAADLIGRLSRSSLVAEAAFIAPIARDPGRGGERFQIRVVLAPAAGRPTP